MAKLSVEARMSIKVLTDKGVSNLEVARLLGVGEGCVRYHRHRQAAGAVDGRSHQVRKAAAFQPAIDAWLAARGEAAPDNVAELHAWLMAEHGYPGSLRSLQRYVREAYPPPPKRARRRVETPPGAQAQADWAVSPRVWVGGRQEDLLAFEMLLSWSRYSAVVWSRRKHALAWLSVHNLSTGRPAGIICPGMARDGRGRQGGITRHDDPGQLSRALQSRSRDRLSSRALPFP